MKALICDAHGDPGKLRVGETETPVPGPGEVLIAVEATAVSFVDMLMVADKHQVHHPVPFIPGMEVAGTVVSTGPDVTHLPEGTRVGALLKDGGHAQFALAKAYETFPIPDEVSAAGAASVVLCGLTAELALTEHARLSAGERLLVGGASGAVGQCAVQLGRAMGARVQAAVSDRSRSDAVLAGGADEVLVYEDLAGMERSERPRCDVVIDPVGGPFGELAIDMMDWSGRYVIVGFAGGKAPPIKGAHLLIKNRSVHGMVLGHYRWNRPDLLAASARRLFSAVAEGQLAIPHDITKDLASIPEAIDGIRNRSLAHRVVVTP
ncbi:hypothetical protein ATO6_15240 [Oceanicola sp. 22II-s10i]|uniref:NADPH:quinone oxidoreductase family protein n=1 Tax=Oceanicola sp. 22II-s10i TaxID=1317116 RepID=UPI000B524FE1|nr:NADPH:quinone oxidoreductase family protein [Oceanicola sp. 22II-s10i]OWU83791.1 hypothetical protein ATO6_15240 [Oceanicola sp. 22II-s10i]